MIVSVVLIYDMCLGDLFIRMTLLAFEVRLHS